jgi:hypothetical protein
MPIKTPQEIVKLAYEYMISVVGPSKIANTRVEELEMIEENKFYRVVLSYENVGQFPFENKKEYKEFKMNAEDGAVVYMKIKNP